MSMTGNDYMVNYNATKLKAQYACGFGVLVLSAALRS